MNEFGGDGILERIRGEPCREFISPGRFLLRVAKDYEEILPQTFYDDPRLFIQHNGKVIKKESRPDSSYPLTEVRLLNIGGRKAVAKRYLQNKSGMGNDSKEFDILLRAKKTGLPGASPIAFTASYENNDPSYVLMDHIEGRSGRKLARRLYIYGLNETQVNGIVDQLEEQYKSVIERYRAIGIDKPYWHSKDTILEMSRSKGKVYRVIPIDFERAFPFDPNKPGQIIIDRTIK